jgi:hypothetical protein
MADSIAKLAVLLTSDVAGFSAGMKQSVQEAKSAGSQIMSALKSAVPGGGFLGAAFSLGAGMATGVGAIEGIQHAATSAWHAMTELGDAAKTVTRESQHLEISVGYYQQLSQAAERAGMASETLIHEMDRLAAKSGELKNGGSAGEEFGQQLRAININPQQWVGEDSEQKFRQISEHLLSIQDHAARVNAEMAIFGRQGAELEEAMRGAAQGRAPVLDDSQVENLTKFHDATANMSREMGNAGKQLSADLAGVILPLVERVARGVHWMFGNPGDDEKRKKAMADQAAEAEKMGNSLRQAAAAQKQLAEDSRRAAEQSAAITASHGALQGLRDKEAGMPAWQSELRAFDQRNAAAHVSQGTRAKLNQQFVGEHQFLDAQALGEKISQEIAGALKGIESPGEKFVAEMRQITTWQADGRLAAPQAQALALHAQDQFRASLKSETPQGPRLATAESQEAFGMMAAAVNGQQSAQAQLAALQQQAVGLNQQAVDLLAQINAAVGNRPVIGGTGW